MGGVRGHAEPCAWYHHYHVPHPRWGGFRTRPYETRPYETRIHGTRIHGTRPYGTHTHGTRPYETRPYGTRIHGTRPYEIRIHGTRIQGIRPYGTPTNGHGCFFRNVSKCCKSIRPFESIAIGIARTLPSSTKSSIM